MQCTVSAEVRMAEVSYPAISDFLRALPSVAVRIHLADHTAGKGQKGKGSTLSMDRVHVPYFLSQEQSSASRCFMDRASGTQDSGATKGSRGKIAWRSAALVLVQLSEAIPLPTYTNR